MANIGSIWSLVRNPVRLGRNGKRKVLEITPRPSLRFNLLLLGRESSQKIIAASWDDSRISSPNSML